MRANQLAEPVRAALADLRQLLKHTQLRRFRVRIRNTPRFPYEVVARHPDAGDVLLTVGDSPEDAVRYAIKWAEGQSP